ncbi:MAG: hypothetical protein LBU64_01410 [Planctomycetota bacterium]|jgi:hypothetical protein|nr:hypothetical protein [Planctomycetota bacterium]
MRPITNRFYPRFLAFLGGLAAAAAAAGAGDSGEFYVNTYRGLGALSPPGLRAAAMGGGGRGLADGAASLGRNPAALGALGGSEFMADLGYDWLDDGYDDAGQTTFRLGGAVNLERWGGTGRANQALGGWLDTRKFTDAAGSGMARDQTGILAAYGLQLTNDLLGGVSVGIFDGSWTSGDFSPVPGRTLSLDRGFTGGDFKLGGLYRLADDLTLGGTLTYGLGSLRERAAYAAGSGTGSLRRLGAGFGAARQYGEDTLFAGDLWFERVSSSLSGTLDERASAWGLSLGVEQRVIPETLALRGGLYYDHVSYTGSSPLGHALVENGSFGKGRFGVTAGAGVRLYSFNLGYSLDVNSGGDVKNLLDVSAQW